MKRELLRATLFGLSSAIVSRGSVFAIMIILAHRLPLSEFGNFSLAYITAMNFGLFIAAGLSQSAGAMIPRVSTDDIWKRSAKLSTYQWLAVFLCGLSAIALFCLYDAISGPQHNNFLSITSGLMLVLGGVGQSLQGLLYSVGRHSDAAKGVVAGSIVSLLCVLGLGSELTPARCLLAICTGVLVTCAMNWLAISRIRLASVGIGPMLSELPQIGKSLCPLLATTALGSPIHSLCVLMLSTSSNGVNEVALFSVSFQFYTVITFVPSVVANVALPFFARVMGSDGNYVSAASNKIFYYSLFIIGTVAITICGLTIVCSGHLLSWLLPERFVHATNTIRVLALAASLSCVSVLFQQKLNGSHLFWLNFFLALTYSAAYVLFAFVSIKLGMGSLGLAISILGAFLILLPCQIAMYKKVSLGADRAKF